MADDLKTEFKGKILAVKDLPTLPKVLEEVTKLIENPDASTDKIAKVISTDQVLTAKVLKMVNSPIYGFPGRIGSIHNALVLLGFNVIRGVIISTSVFDIMTKSMVGLWEHSVGCALACTELAKAANLKDPEEYAVAGLLHDLGKVVAAVQLPQSKAEIDALVKAKDLTYLDAEKKVLGFGHDRINAWLAGYWRLPVRLTEGIAKHHHPTTAEHYPAAACVVHVADFLVRLMEYGSGGDDNVSRLDVNAIKILKLGMKDLENVLDALCNKFIEVADLSFA
jgi:HD-like signal output (HDOD) protein